MSTVISDSGSAERMTFVGDSAVLGRVAALPGSPISRTGADSFSWDRPTGAPLTRSTLTLALYVWGATYEEVGVLLGVSRERVRQILSTLPDLSITDIKELRRANRDSTEAQTVAAHSKVIADHLAAHGPGTVDEVATAIGLPRSATKRAWPVELAHLQLAHLKSTTHVTWSDDAVLDALRAASIYEFPLTRNKYDALQRVGQIDGPTGVRVMQRFGTWSAACELAGVQAGVPRAAPYESRWTDDELLKFVIDYLSAPLFGGTFAGYDTWRREGRVDGPSSGTLRNRLGPWSDIKRRALERMWSNHE